MRFTKLLVVLPFLCFAVLTGCKGKCESNCDNAKDQDCSHFDHDECLHGCISYEDMQKDTTKCDDEWDALQSCISDLSDICKVEDSESDSTKCKSEIEDFNTCYMDYCTEHPTRDYCS